MKFALKSYNSHQDEFVCIYDMDELSLYTSDCGTDGSLVVNGTYICLDFDIKTQEVKEISGFVGNLADLKSVKVSNVNTKYDAKLVVDADEAFMAGIGYGINLEYEIMYDKFNRYICILPLARKSLQDEYYRIAGNIFVALNDSVIEGILIKL